MERVYRAGERATSRKVERHLAICCESQYGLESVASGIARDVGETVDAAQCPEKRPDSCPRGSVLEGPRDQRIEEGYV